MTLGYRDSRLSEHKLMGQHRHGNTELYQLLAKSRNRHSSKTPSKPRKFKAQGASCSDCGTAVMPNLPSNFEGGWCAPSTICVRNRRSHKISAPLFQQKPLHPREFAGISRDQRELMFQGMAGDEGVERTDGLPHGSQ